MRNLRGGKGSTEIFVTTKIIIRISIYNFMLENFFKIRFGNGNRGLPRKEDGSSKKGALQKRHRGSLFSLWSID